MNTPNEPQLAPKAPPITEEGMRKTDPQSVAYWAMIDAAAARTKATADRIEARLPAKPAIKAGPKPLVDHPGHSLETGKVTTTPDPVTCGEPDAPIELSRVLETLSATAYGSSAGDTWPILDFLKRNAGKPLHFDGTTLRAMNRTSSEVAIEMHERDGCEVRGNPVVRGDAPGPCASCAQKIRDYESTIKKLNRENKASNDVLEAFGNQAVAALDEGKHPEREEQGWLAERAIRALRRVTRERDRLTEGLSLRNGHYQEVCDKLDELRKELVDLHEKRREAESQNTKLGLDNAELCREIKTLNEQLVKLSGVHANAQEIDRLEDRLTDETCARRNLQNTEKKLLLKIGDLQGALDKATCYATASLPKSSSTTIAAGCTPIPVPLTPGAPVAVKVIGEPVAVGSRAYVANVMDNVFDECRALRGAGQKEYAHREDNAFANFERVAERMKQKREAVLMVYTEKHLDGIHSWIQGHKSQREDVTGRINDVIVYMVILRAMIEQAKRHPATAS